MGSNRRVCKLERAFKTMEQKRNIGVKESGPSNNSMRKIGGSAVNNQVMTLSSDDQVRRREEEKAEMLFHLIFWGPN
ncbi:hypothetical protein JCGZ_00710 [Jatropha curcas]|uniref:Uncharacterized protein n=1 Tax=Jatropha curcas TaxID=180498 RepID=A0A067KVD4_JATCU|nr:hypothetical protein JCGZ_00710 [Jatropha curcas]